MRYCPLSFRQLLSLILLAATLLLPSMAKAASCSYTNFSIGTEYVAVEANTTTGEYRYVASPILSVIAAARLSTTQERALMTATTWAGEFLPTFWRV